MKSWRDDPSVKFCFKRGFSPWDIYLVNCPSVECGAQNYFEEGLSESCRLCGAKIGDRGDEMYSVGTAMELEIDDTREQAFDGTVCDMLDESQQMPPSIDPLPPPPPTTPGQRALTLLWILICIAFVSALAWLGHHFDQRF